MRNGEYIVRATWDDKARVWQATSDDVPGLATEAETFGDLRAQLFEMVPSLLRKRPEDVALSIIADRFIRTA